MTSETLLKNGRAAAALLAGGIGSLMVGLLTTLSEAVEFVGTSLNWIKPVGPLSGKTTLAVIIWLIVWVVLNKQWKDKDVEFDKFALISLILLLFGILGTFPPFFGIFM